MMQYLRQHFCTSRVLVFQKIQRKNQSTSKHKGNLVILHAIMAHGGHYRHLAEHPAVIQNYDTYLLDFRNHGKSFWAETMGIQELAADVKEWIDKNKLKNLTIIGHSMGGRTLISLTEQFPKLQQIVNKVIILDASPRCYLGFPFMKKSIPFMQKLQKIDFTQKQQDIISYVKSICVNPNQQKMVMQGIDMQNRKFKFNLGSIIKEYNKLCEYECLKTDWRGEVHVLKANKASYVTQECKEELRKIYPGLKSIKDLDCYHNIHEEKPEEVIRLL